MRRVELIGMKRCPACKSYKPLDEFGNNRSTKDGKVVYCKPCDRARHKKWVAENPEKYKRSRRDHELKKRYGMAKGDFDKLFEEQDGRCAICGTLEPGHKGVFAVDHCHNTGNVRGLLCVNCNRGIGWLKDDPMIVEAALHYLRRN